MVASVVFVLLASLLLVALNTVAKVRQEQIELWRDLVVQSKKSLDDAEKNVQWWMSRSLVYHDGWARALDAWSEEATILHEMVRELDTERNALKSQLEAADQIEVGLRQALGQALELGRPEHVANRLSGMELPMILHWTNGHEESVYEVAFLHNRHFYAKGTLFRVAKVEVNYETVPPMTIVHGQEVPEIPEED